MNAYDTITEEISNGVAWVTLDRPEVHNAFNRKMQQELRTAWRSYRHNDDVRCIVLTGAGDKAFCTGIDRTEQMGNDSSGRAGSDLDTDQHRIGAGSTPFHFDDPGDFIGPKANDLWKPVIAAVNGMACGGAFYMLGEVEFIIAADHATFFDPHVTYGMCATFEPIHMLQKMPFGEVMRMTLLGNHERLSAQRAHEVGLVSEVVPGAELADAARWAAEAIGRHHHWPSKARCAPSGPASNTVESRHSTWGGRSSDSGPMPSRSDRARSSSRRDDASSGVRARRPQPGCWFERTPDEPQARDAPPHRRRSCPDPAS